MQSWKIGFYLMAGKIFTHAERVGCPAPDLKREGRLFLDALPIRKAHIGGE
jgi:hypothetical protein